MFLDVPVLGLRKFANWYAKVRTSNFGREKNRLWGPRPVSLWFLYANFTHFLPRVRQFGALFPRSQLDPAVVLYAKSRIHRGSEEKVRQNLRWTDRSSVLCPSLGPSIPGTTLDKSPWWCTETVSTNTVYLCQEPSTEERSDSLLQ